MLGQIWKTASYGVVRNFPHCLSPNLLESCSRRFITNIFLFCNAVGVVWVFKLAPTRQLVITFQRVRSHAIRLWSFQQSSRLGSHNFLSVKVCGDHLLWTSFGICEDTKTLSRTLSAGDVACLKTSSLTRLILGCVGHSSWFATINIAYLVSFVVLIHDSISRVKWVRATFRFSFYFCHVVVIVSSVTARVPSRLVAHLGLGAVNVINFHCFTRGSTCHRIHLRPTSVDIVDVHLVSDESRRCCRSDFNFRNLVVWIQGIISLSFRLKLDNLGSCPLYVVSFQVCFRFVKSYMECARARSVDVPVLV